MRSALSSGRLMIGLALVMSVLVGSCTQPRTHATIGIVYKGGPPPGTSDVLRPGTVRVLRSDGSLLATKRLADGTDWSLELPAGRYWVETDSGDALCPGRAITVGSGSSVSVPVAGSLR